MQGRNAGYWSQHSVGSLFSIAREAVIPASFPKEAFEHYSIPAWDTLGGPIVELGSAIGSNKTLLTRELILVSKLNPRKPRVVLVGRANNLRRCASTEFIPYVPRSSDTDLGFFKWFFESRIFHDMMDRVAVGSTNSHVRASPPESLKWLIPLPDLPEQQRIAEILDTLDDAILKTKGIIAKLRQIKQGLLHDLLTRGLDDNGELRDPDRHPEQFHMTALGRLPEGWEIAPFKRFETPARPFLKTGPFGSSLKGEHWVSEGVPVITIGALGEGEFIHSELLFVSERTSKRLSAYIVRPGDIVFSRVADVGRSVVVKQGESGWIMSSNLMWISLDQATVAPEYVWLNLSGNPSVRSQVRRFVNAGGREVANGRILQSLRLAWPKLLEQQEIVKRAHALDQKRQSEEVALAKLLALKNGLMDDLLTSRVRVTKLIEKAA